MKRYKVIDLLDEVISGEWGQEPCGENDVKVLRTTNFTNEGRLDLNKEVVTRSIDMKKIEKKKLQYGDIIIEKSGGSPDQPVGRVVYFDIDDNDSYLCNNFTSILRPNSKVVENKYLLYFLYYQHKTKKVLKYQNKTTGIINLKLDNYLKRSEIVLPSRKIQQRIVQLLDKSYELIDKRKAQIEALDQLTKSVFLEMFGDPRNNPKKFNKVPLGELFEIKTGGTPSRKNKEYWNGDIPWVKTTEVNENVIMHTEEFITEEGLSNSNVVLLPANTLLIAMYGQGKTRGRTAKLGIEATTNQACAALLPNPEIDQDFIWRQLIIRYEELRSLGRGGNQPNLNLNLVRQFEVIVPSNTMQKEFVGKVKKIDNSKNVLENSIEELENMFNSLLQRAFKGKLFTEEKVFNL